MEKLYFVFILLLISTSSFGQIKFEEGYIITSDNKKIECLIKNKDWNNNPNKFMYKIPSQGDEIEGSIEYINEFGIYNVAKYVKADVNIDRSSSSIGRLSNSNEPEFQKETLFLKVLVDGDATLYSFTDKSLLRFFYQTKESSIEQLVFKKYMIDDQAIGTNDTYLQQLNTKINCGAVNDQTTPHYMKKDLVEYFIAHNKCKNADYTVYNSVDPKSVVNINLRPGMSNSSLWTVGTYLGQEDVDFGSKSSFRLGVEAEVVLPFNNGKWSFSLEPNYHSFKKEVPMSDQNALADYKAIGIPFTARHYFFLPDAGKIFINGIYSKDIPMSSKIDFENSNDLDISRNSTFGLGLGYNNNKTISIEARHLFERPLLSYLYWESGLTSSSIIVGYKVF